MLIQVLDTAPPFEGRTRCPFYGFSNWIGFLMDQQGNECAFLPGTSCQMEMANLAPDWEACLFFSQEQKEHLMTQMAGARVAPRELWPGGQGDWEGIALADWVKRILEAHEAVQED